MQQSFGSHLPWPALGLVGEGQLAHRLEASDLGVGVGVGPLPPLVAPGRGLGPLHLGVAELEVELAVVSSEVLERAEDGVEVRAVVLLAPGPSVLVAREEAALCVVVQHQPPVLVVVVVAQVSH